MKRNLFFASLCFLVVSVAINGKAQNFNNCIRALTSGSGNPYVAINSLSLDTMDFTVELWIKIDTDAYAGTSPFNDPSILGNKDWNSGANTGLEIAIYTGGLYKVNFTPNGISRTDLVSSQPDLENRWNHIAVTFDRQGFMRMYSNGILTDSIDISSGHGHTIDASYPYNLCDDGTGSYPHPFAGYVDEFRIWSEVRTTDQIRQYMCRTLPAGMGNLLVYYPMQQTTGTTVPDASGNGHNGTLTNLTSGAWVASGAAVGDTSVYVYPALWTGVSLSLSSPGSGTVTVDTVSNAMTGLQLYRTNYPPNTNSGITVPGTDSVYFGVYPFNISSTYNLTYNYSGYPAAMTYESGIALFNRPNLYTPWSSTGASKNTSTHELHVAGLSKDRHFVIGNFVNTTLIEPVSADNKISVYPNPVANGLLHFESVNNQKTTLNLFNTAGILLMTACTEAWPFTMDVSGLPAGLYFVNCSAVSSNESFRISVIK